MYFHPLMAVRANEQVPLGMGVCVWAYCWRRGYVLMLLDCTGTHSTYFKAGTGKAGEHRKGIGLAFETKKQTHHECSSKPICREPAIML